MVLSSLIAVLALLALAAADEPQWTHVYAQSIEAMFVSKTGLPMAVSTASLYASYASSTFAKEAAIPQSHDFILNTTSFCIDSAHNTTGDVAQCASVISVDHFEILDEETSSREYMDLLNQGQVLAAFARLSSHTSECTHERSLVLLYGFSTGPNQEPIWMIDFADGATKSFANGHAKRCGLFESVLVPVFALPVAWDWRQHNAVTPVYNQGQLGDVLAIVATEALESLHAIKTNVLVELNYNEVSACCGSQVLSWNIFSCVQSIGGVCMASSTPASSCNNHTCKAVATLTGFSTVTSGNTTALQEAVLINPVAAAIDAGIEGFQVYTGGVFNPASCSPAQIDHAVLVVGWGQVGSQPYWILKNSWGTAWGEQGYMLLIRDAQDKCGIAVSAAYPTCSKAAC